MKFDDFLKNAINKNFWAKQKVICFIGNDHPFLFFNYFFTKCKNNNFLPAEYKNLPLNTTDSIQLMGSLQQSFLGQLNFYWLSECEIKTSGSKKNNILDFLLQYKGPNFIAFYLNEEKINSQIRNKLKKILTIEISPLVDEKLFKQIASFFNQKISSEHFRFISNLLKNNNASIDQAFMWIKYLELTSNKASNKVYEYLTSIISEEQPSLNKLSQLFFSRKAKPFFDLWAKIHNEYSEMFWIAFWSEQIFKAYYVVKFLNKKNFMQARKISFRLPFSFINNDWKTFSLNELSKQHEFIYNNDFKIKKGSTYCFLDLFYFNHFTGFFKSEN